MITLQLINKINELLYIAKTELTVAWDRSEGRYYILKNHALIVYSSSKLFDIVYYIEREVRGWYLLHG